MPRFSRRSIERLNSCHPDIERVMVKAIEIYDFTVLEGHRPKEKQDKAYAEGNSKAKWPDSKHNTLPSRAIDIAPWQNGSVQIHDREEITYMAGIIMGVAHVLGVPLRWGGDWNMNEVLSDNSFDDLFHFELVGE